MGELLGLPIARNVLTTGEDDIHRYILVGLQIDRFVTQLVNQYTLEGTNEDRRGGDRSSACWWHRWRTTPRPALI